MDEFNRIKTNGIHQVRGVLSELIDLDTGVKETLLRGFQSMGIKSFFSHLDSVELSPETIEKLKSIKSIIELSDIKR